MMNSYTATDVFVHERFAAHAASAPDQPALEDERHHLTYHQVRYWAEELAARLRVAGVQREDVVGLYLDRSAEAVVAMLGVLFAGAAYLSLPPTYPTDRLRYMADDARVSIVVAGDIPPPPGLTMSAPLMTIGSPPAGPPRDTPRPPIVVHPGSAAYVIYTSGSTGTPKGVVVSHQNVANLVSSAQRYVSFSERETVLQLSPLAFDPSALEIWGALANGGRLVVSAPSYTAIDDLPSILAEKRISTLVLTPPLFHPLIERRPDSLDGVAQLIVGGDVLSARSSRIFVDRPVAAGSSPRLMINAYGPTEATTMVSAQPMHLVSADTERVPIGSPISGARILLLDQEMRPVSAGGTGQIYLAGAAVTRGYLYRPALTAERFLPDVTPAAPGSRMYATGDEGLLDEAGQIIFIGRLDDQVKVRGHRVELSEIDHVLRDFPGVADAAVTLTDRGGQRERLVAHIVLDSAPTAARMTTSNGESTPSDSARAFLFDLDAHLKARLPGYMHPSTYSVRAALPLTRSGKVDRVALAAGEPSLHASRQSDEGTRSSLTNIPGLTDTESVLAEIWQANLDLNQVDIDDDFFALGGTSILAINIVADAQDRGLPLTLVTMFRNPTVRRAAGALAGNLPSRTSSGT